MMILLPQGSTPRAATPELAALQARALDLRDAVAKLKAQHDVLDAQARSSEGYLRIPAQMQLAQVNAELATTQAELMSVQGRIALLSGQTLPPPPAAIVQPPPVPRFLDRIDNDAITAVFVMSALAILIPLSIGLARKLWRRGPKESTTGAALNGVNSRLERLEQAVDAIAIEIERVSESQRFIAKVLVERPPSPPASTAVASDANAAPALGDAKPFLALGAGPMEPISIPQKQAVRQSITPH
jgi:cell division protein FtsB